MNVQKLQNNDGAQWCRSAIILRFCLVMKLFSHFKFSLTSWEVKEEATTSCKYCITHISPPQQSSGTFKALLKAQTRTKQTNTEDVQERLVFCVTHGMAHLTSEGKPKQKTIELQMLHKEGSVNVSICIIHNVFETDNKKRISV